MWGMSCQHSTYIHTKIEGRTTKQKFDLETQTSIICHTENGRDGDGADGDNGNGNDDGDDDGDDEEKKKKK